MGAARTDAGRWTGDSRWKRSWTLVLLFAAWVTLSGQVHFMDVAQEAGIGHLGGNYGISFADFDNDGWEDLYITQRDGPNRLYRNRGDGSFEELAAEVGLDYPGNTRLAVWGDVNNDGWTDVFLGNDKGLPDLLFLNRGGAYFEDISTVSGMHPYGNVMGAMMGDVNNDGWLDIYVSRWNDQNSLYMNQGDRRFKDEIFLRRPTHIGAAMGALFVDYDNDRDLDIYLVHDNRQPNVLYQNDGAGFFIDVSEAAGADYAGFGMGVDFGDVNNDGWLDIYVTNLYPNTLLVNQGDGSFVEHTQQMGLGDEGMGWGTAFIDVDNDGWQDIYLANSTPAQPNMLYLNRDGQYYESFAHPQLNSYGNSYGLACADYNRDGKMDMVVSNAFDQTGTQLFRNECINDNAWVEMRLIGTQSNRSGIGARAELMVNGRKLIDEVASGSSWVSQNSLILHWGLGQASQIDSLVIQWPSGITDVFEALPVNQLWTIEEGQSRPVSVKITAPDLSAITISPNPARDRFQLAVESTNYLELDLSLVDMAGRLVQRLPPARIRPGKQTLSYPLHRVPEGIYLIYGQYPHGSFCKKILIGKG